MRQIESPLSDLISQPGGLTDEHYAEFLDLFCSSRVGVIVVDAHQGAEGDVVSSSESPISLGNTSHGDLDNLILAFADPLVFVRNFGPKFNGEMEGVELVRTALHNPDCQGILVNSAKAETSIVIDRQTAMSLLPGLD